MHVLSGNGGPGSHHVFDGKKTPMTRFQSEEFGYGVLTATNDSVVVFEQFANHGDRLIDNAGGKLIDSFVVERSSATAGRPRYYDADGGRVAETIRLKLDETVSERGMVSNDMRYTRLLLDPRVVNLSATSAILQPGRPQKHPRNPLLTDKFRAPNNGATLEGKPRVLYDANTQLFKLWYDFPSCRGVDGAFSDTLYRQSTDGLHWPLPNESIGMIIRHNITATGGNGKGPIGTVPNVVLPCCGTIGVMHDPEDVTCPFKAMGQFNFGTCTSYST